MTQEENYDRSLSADRKEVALEVEERNGRVLQELVEEKSR
jgi:hypothetical protein